MIPGLEGPRGQGFSTIGTPFFAAPRASLLELARSLCPGPPQADPPSPIRRANGASWSITREAWLLARRGWSRGARGREREWSGPVAGGQAAAWSVRPRASRLPRTLAPGQLEVTALGELLPTAPIRYAALARDQGAARLAVRRLGASASVERSAGPSLHPPPRALAEPGLPAAARTGVGEAIGWRPSATGAARGSGRSWQGPSRSREPQRGGAGALLELRPLGAVVEGPEWPRRRLTSRCRRRRPRR